MFVLLIGPKGSGKSHVGRVLEARLGVHFFHVEPLWLAYHAECEASGRQPAIAEGIARVHPVLDAALDTHAHVCAETTGASAEILEALLSLRPRPEILVARVSAPPEVCRQRIAERDPRHQIPVAAETVRKVHALSESLQLRPDVMVDNVRLTESEIVALFERPLRTGRGRPPG